MDLNWYRRCVAAANHSAVKKAKDSGKDSLIALATVDEGIHSVRTVDAMYIDGAFLW